MLFLVDFLVKFVSHHRNKRLQLVDIQNFLWEYLVGISLFVVFSNKLKQELKTDRNDPNQTIHQQTDCTTEKL